MQNLRYRHVANSIGPAKTLIKTGAAAAAAVV